MHLLALETEEERCSFDKMYLEHLGQTDCQYYLIGGILETIDDYKTWHWIASKEAITIKLQFNPGVPDNKGGEQHCLLIEKKDKNSFVFNDCSCSQQYSLPFICERKVKK